MVCEHLEDISRDALEKYQDIIRGYVKRRHGVYALYRRGKLYYVGLAGNLRLRLHSHLKDHHGKSWDRFSVYLTVGDVHLRELEALILRIVKPIGNKQKGKFPKADDLRRSFDRAMMLHQQTERRRILGGKMSPAPARSNRPTAKDASRSYWNTSQKTTKKVDFHFTPTTKESHSRPGSAATVEFVSTTESLLRPHRPPPQPASAGPVMGGRFGSTSGRLATGYCWTK